MSKLSLGKIILYFVVIAGIAILAAAAFLPGFKEWVSINVISPLFAAGGGFLDGISASPFWHQWTGYLAIGLSCFVLGVMSIVVLIPRLPVLKKAAPTYQPQGAPKFIQSTAPATSAPKAKATPVPASEPEVKAEAKTEEPEK